MKEISKWQRGDLEVKLLVDGLNTDSFVLESNFPMWKIDDAGYSLQTLYNSACSACVQEDVYDDNTGEYMYSRDVEPPEVDYWYNPFKSYRYNFPYNKEKGILYDDYSSPAEKRTVIWGDGFDKIGYNEKPHRTKRFNIGKQFLCSYDPNDPRLLYQKNNESSRWAFDPDNLTVKAPNLNSCLTTDRITYNYDKTHELFTVRFFESRGGSLLSYLWFMVPPEYDIMNSDRMPVRFYDNLTGELYYLSGRAFTDARLFATQQPYITSFENLKLRHKRFKLNVSYKDSKISHSFYLAGTYKANNVDRNLQDLCEKRVTTDLNQIGSWGEIIEKIIADNNLDKRFIMDSRLVFEQTAVNKDKDYRYTEAFEILDSISICVKTDSKIGTNLPVDDPEALDEIFSHGIRIITEDVVYVPSFIINDKLSVGFPVQFCYTSDPSGIRTCEIANYGWDEKRQGIAFDVVLHSTMLNDSISISLEQGDLTIDGFNEYVINPPIRNSFVRTPYNGSSYDYERFVDFDDNFALGHPCTVSGDAKWEYLGMHTDAVETCADNTVKTYGPINLTTYVEDHEGSIHIYDNVYNTIPMQANGQIKFIVARTYHCFVPGTVLNNEIVITGDFIKTPVRKRVSFAKYSADVHYEKITNNVDVELPGGVILKANMYDATKICIKDELGTAFNLDKAIIYINELIPNGKSCEFALNKTPDDFVFIEPFQYNEATGYDEVVIYISAKNSEGLGFNDAVVNFSFELPEEIRKKYNLGTTSWNVGYRTYLPPFLIQGIPEKAKADAIDPVIPKDLSRVNYPAYPYQASRLGWKENYLFTNADPLYHVVASGFIPSDLGDFEYSNVSSYIKDESTGMKTFLDYTTSVSSKTIPTLISGYSEFASTSIETTYEGDFIVYEYYQMIKSDDLATKKSLTKNSVNISARCEYDLNAEADSLSTHVVRLSEDGTVMIEGA